MHKQKNRSSYVVDLLRLTSATSMWNHVSTHSYHSRR